MASSSSYMAGAGAGAGARDDQQIHPSTQESKGEAAAATVPTLIPIEKVELRRKEGEILKPLDRFPYGSNNPLEYYINSRSLGEGISNLIPYLAQNGYKLKDKYYLSLHGFEPQDVKAALPFLYTLCSSVTYYHCDIESYHSARVNSGTLIRSSPDLRAVVLDLPKNINKVIISTWDKEFLWSNVIAVVPDLPHGIRFLELSGKFFDISEEQAQNFCSSLPPWIEGLTISNCCLLKKHESEDTLTERVQRITKYLSFIPSTIQHFGLEYTGLCDEPEAGAAVAQILAALPRVRSLSLANNGLSAFSPELLSNFCKAITNRLGGVLKVLNLNGCFTPYSIMHKNLTLRDLPPLKELHLDECQLTVTFDDITPSERKNLIGFFETLPLIHHVLSMKDPIVTVLYDDGSWSTSYDIDFDPACHSLPPDIVETLKETVGALVRLSDTKAEAAINNYKIGTAINLEQELTLPQPEASEGRLPIKEIRYLIGAYARVSKSVYSNSIPSAAATASPAAVSSSSSTPPSEAAVSAGSSSSSSSESVRDEKLSTHIYSSGLTTFVDKQSSAARPAPVPAPKSSNCIIL